MSISSSMNAGVMGLKANATRLATISDNISNSATYGYKRATTSFHSMVTGSGIAGQATYSAGGVRTSSGRMIDESGSLIGTQNATDLAISGRGFLPVTTELGANLTDGTAPLLLTTTGSFRPDANGFLRDPSGNTLLGWPVNAQGELPAVARDSISGLRPVTIGPADQAAQATSMIDLNVTLPATNAQPGAPGAASMMSVEYFDAFGIAKSIDAEFEPVNPDTAPNTWTMVLRNPATGDVLGSYQLEFSGAVGNAGTLLNITQTAGPPDVDGTVTLDLDGQEVAFNIGAATDGGGIVQRGTNFLPTGVQQDGFPASNLIGVTIDAKGNLDAIYDGGFRRTLYRIPVVDVPNPNGLTSRDNQTFSVSRDSGPFFLWDAGEGPVGDFVGFALEESAVDVATELTSLIQTQRAYSSNAKIVQTVDEMLQETTNLKR